MKPNAIILLAASVSLLALPDARAGSATWSANPATGDWNTAANWMPNTVPNGATDTATFDQSNVTDVSTSADIEVESMVFNLGASAYTITINPNLGFLVSGAGITNNSAVMQNIVTAAASSYYLVFSNSATLEGPITVTSSFNGGTAFADSASAGSANIITLPGQGGFVDNGYTSFSDTATAGNATFLSPAGESGTYGGQVLFSGNSIAGNATFFFDGNSGAEFSDNSDAGNATFHCNDFGGIGFFDHSSAGSANITNAADTVGSDGAATNFGNESTGDNCTVTNSGSTTSSAGYGSANFDSSANGGDGTFINNGSLIAGGKGGLTSFASKTSAGNATLIANDGGANAGGNITFIGTSVGGTARVEVFGNGSLHIDAHGPTEVPIGSLEGDGPVVLGKRLLIVGSNSLSTTYSGVIQGTGSVRKNGDGTLTFTGANTYSLGTYIDSGTLAVSNQNGSGVGSGLVQVNAGTLGGSGSISGPVTVGDNSGLPAYLAPAVGGSKQAVLTILSSLTLQADATYTYTYKARSNQARTDEVVANGVTINSGASIALSGKVQGKLHRGLVLTVLSNTSANPIAGTFSNLPDGALLSVGSNTLKASYEGGDGNDVTLTVQ